MNIDRPPLGECATLDDIQRWLDWEDHVQAVRNQLDEHLVPLGLNAEGVLAGVREIDLERTMAPSNVGEEANAGTDTGYLEGAVARRYITSWWAHGLSIDQVATLVGRTTDLHNDLVAEIDRYISSRTKVLSERLVLEHHRLGMSPGDIARKLSMHRNTVDNVLRRLDVSPHLKQPRVVEQTRNGVISDRNRGFTYPQLRSKYDLTTNQVRSILRHAAKAGLVLNYGTDVGDGTDAA